MTRTLVNQYNCIITKPLITPMIFDCGHISAAKNKNVDFEISIIVMTSNANSDSEIEFALHEFFISISIFHDRILIL